MMDAMDFLERMEFGGARATEKPVPDDGPEPNDTAEPAIEIAKTDRPHQPGQIATEFSNGHDGGRRGIDRHHEEHGRSRQGRDHRLRDDGSHGCDPYRWGVRIYSQSAPDLSRASLQPQEGCEGGGRAVLAGRGDALEQVEDRLAIDQSRIGQRAFA